MNNDTHELDLLNRADFATDDAYLEAAADLRIKRSSPEFQKALREMRAEQARREQAQLELEQAKRFEELCQSIKLDAYDLGTIQSRAQKNAASMVQSGKIRSDELLSTVSRLEQQYTEDFKRTKASNAIINEAVRNGAQVSKTTL